MECKNDVYDVSEHGYPSENRKSTSSHPIKSSDTLLAEAFELQKEYQTAQKKKVSDKRLQSIRVSIRGIYYQLIKQDPVTASEHDVEPMLWKYGFYKRIDELRVRLKKCQSALKKTPNNSQSQLERQAKVKKVFRNVVSEAKKFYESMFLEYLNAANVRRTGSAFVDLLVDASNETDDDGEADTSSSFSNGKDKDGHVDITSVSPAQRERMYLALHTAHRCLVYLGDLERYYQEHEEAEKKNWSKAERYYSQALQLLPENGNPHNQLAVVATFNQDDVSAAHRYFRSLAVLGLPFPTAKDNLALIFHKNELKFRKLFPRLSSKGSVSSRVDKKHIESRIKSKRELYICLLKMYSLVSSEGNDFNADDEQLFILLEKPVIHKVDELILRSPSISTDTKEKNSCLHFVLFLLVGCIFSVHRTLKGEGATVKYTPMTSHVCQWAFDFIGIIIQSISREDLSLLRPLGVFCDWLKLHPTLLKPSATSSSAYVSEAERAQRNLFWDQLSRLMNTLQHIAIDKEEALSPGGPALPEEMELRGFSYLRDAYATVGSDFASVRKTGELAPGSAKSKRKSRGRYRREKLQSLHVSRRILKVLNFGKLVADKFGLLTFNKSTNLWSFVPLIYESSKYVRSPSSKGRTSPSNAIAPSSSSTSSSSSSSAMYGAGSNTGDIGGSSSRHSSRSSRAHESHRRALLHKRSISQGNLAELNEPSLYQRERERSERHPNLERRSQSDRSLETAHMQQNHMSMSGHHSPSLTLSHPHHLNGAPQHRQGSSPTQGLHNVMHHSSQPQQQPQQTDMYVDSPSSSSHGRGRRSPVAVGSGSSTPNRVDPFGTPTHKNSNMLPHKTPGKLTSSSSSSCAPSDEQLHHHHQWNPLGEQKQYLNFFEFGTHLGSGGNGTSTPSAASTGSTSSSSSSSLSSSSHWPTASNPTSDHTLGSSFSSWQKNNYNSAFVSSPNHSHQQGYGSSQWGQPQLQGHGPSTSPPSSSPSSSSSSMVRNQQGTVPQSRHHNSQHHNHNNHHPTSTSSSSSSSAPVHGNHHGVSAHSHRVSEQLSSYGESMFGVNTMSQEGVNLHQHPHSLSHHPHQPHTMNNTHHTNSLPPPPSSSSSSTSNSAAAWGNPNPNQQSFIDEANYFSAFGSSSSSLFSMAPTTPTSGNTSGKSSPPHSLFMGSAYAPQQQQPSHAAPEGHLRQNKSVHHEAPHVYGESEYHTSPSLSQHRHHGEEYGWGQASYSRNHNNYH